MNLYSTGTVGYGSGATLLATTTSGGSGQFTFPANTCVPGTEVYVTAAGGYTGANTANSNSVLVAAIGDCANVNSSTFTYISEMTTVAAAYALGNFTTITGSGASTFVNIGAPLANSAATPSCTGSGASMVCTAAGMKHAFANALNLASTTTGLAYTTTPSNPNGVVPTVLLNTLADIVQACVNSTGGVAGDGSGCGLLFTNTTPPASSTASGIVPTNTFQAMVNLAEYPTMTSGQVGALFALSAPSAFFQPTLTTAPHDFSVAVYYTGVTISSNTTGFGYPYFLALDYNDNVYSVDNVSSSGGPVTSIGMAANGAPLYAGATISTAVCTAGVPCMAMPDTSGTLWVANGSSSAGNLYPVSTANGSVGTALPAGTGPVFGVAVDKYNTVFTSVPSSSAANTIYSAPLGGSSLSPVLANGVAITQPGVVPAALFFDGSGSLWNASWYSAGTVVNGTYLANTSSTSTVFGGAPVQTAYDAAANLHGGPYGIVADSSGNGWTNGGGEASSTTASAYLYRGTLTNTTVTSFLIQNGSVFAVSPRYSAIDGADNIFMPDNNGSSASYIWQFLPGTSNFVNLLPCAVATSTTVCSTTSATVALQDPRNAQVDSTGSIWVSSSTNGRITQIIGTAAPTWPQLSYGHPGLTPQ